MTLVTKIIIALAATCSVTLATAAAVQQDPRTGIVTEKVAFPDLNLEDAAGAQALYARIKAAATRVCYATVPDYTNRRGWKACYNKALSDAVATINRSQLTAVHAAAAKAARQG